MNDIQLRDVLAEDLPLIFRWENDPANWEVSDTQKAYSTGEILALIASSSDYEETQQKRWMIIEKNSKQAIGTVDIFQGNLKENETGIGILIAEPKNRRKGFASQAINIAMEKAHNLYDIGCFFAQIHKGNLASLALFKKCGYQAVSAKEDNPNFDSTSSEIITMYLCVKK
jgi:diamine N-acetyltransferase